MTNTTNRDVAPPPTSCYTPLAFDAEKKVAEFRIVTISPGNWAEPIRCRLTVHSLHRPPQYKTISYAWGDPQDTGQVFIDNERLTVPRSLELCLRYLRSNDTPIDLWTDAICIDQTNLSERAQQVMQMGYIYWNCASLYIWLGEPGPVSENDNPFGIIEHWVADHHFYDYPGFSRSEETGLWTFEDNPAYQKLNEVFSDFTSRSWWTRLWCVQEIALCPEATVVMGKWQLPWATILKARANHSRHDVTCCEGISNLMPAKYSYSADRMLFLSQKFDQTNMDQIVRSLRHKLCKDPRDKIYGLLGLLWKNPKARIEANYSLPPGKLYTDYTKKIIEQSNGDLRFLTGSGLGSSSFEMPSWVRNFAAPLDGGAASHESFRYHFYDIYDACAQRKSEAKVIGNNILCLSGTFVDRVEAKGTPLRHRDWAHIIEIIRSWAQVAGISALDSLMIPGSPQDFFWRTILADYMPTGPSSGSPWRRIPSPAPAMTSDWFTGAQESLDAGQEPVRPGSLNALWSAAHAREFFRTEKGHYGLCFPQTEPRDEVWVLAGGKVPFVLRRCEDAGAQVEVGNESNRIFKMVGECYLHGFMDGEALVDNKELVPIQII